MTASMISSSAVDLASFIAGEWREGTGHDIVSENPARPSETVARGRAASVADVDTAVAAARRAGRDWSAMPAHERGAVLRRASRLVADRAEEWGAELAREEGKTLPEGVGEVRRAAQILDYYGADADRESGSLYSSPRRGERIMVTRRPLGTVALITPFNFPIAIPAWKIAPALAYGNTVVWKPAHPVPLLAMRLAQALDEAGLPAGVLSLVLGEGEIGQALVEHAGIDGVSFTGSTRVGRAIAASCAGRGVPVQAELGGKNAAVVLADADLELAAGQILAGAFNSTGQKCTATSRLVVVDAVADDLLALLTARADELVVGNPLAEGTRLGPVVSGSARGAIASGVDTALAEGARVLTSRPLIDDADGDGHFVRPAILEVQGADDFLWREELFGPVLAAHRVGSADEAFDLADAGPFGLSAAVFTTDLGTALESIDRLDVGMLHVNSETAGADPHVPFGGSKGSAFGPREQGQAARDFYTSTTTVYLRGTA